jgi:APA family basic amino acid/polyamine antiporter
VAADSAVPPTDLDHPTYARRLGPFSATMVVVGGIIGAGIFLNPAIVAQRVGSAGLTLAVWGIGALIALAGALCFGELGSRRPRAGGGYVYLREAFGPLPAFLYGWALLLVMATGAIGAVAVTFARYTVALTGWGHGVTVPLAVAAIVVVSAVNYVGVQPGAVVQNVFTLLKLAALAALIVAGLVAIAGGHQAPAVAEAARPASLGQLVRAVGAALVPVLFAYGGWQQSNFVAEEMIAPERNLPRAIVLGVIIVVAVYLLANVTYLGALGAGGLAASGAPAADTMERLAGPAGKTLISAGIAVSTFGFLNLVILVSPRVYQAMAADGSFLPQLARIHPRYRTPAAAIVFQCAWAVLLTLSGSYGQLLDWVVFGDWIFFGLAVSALFVYRRRAAEREQGPSSGDGGAAAPAEGGYRALGYPVTPALFVASAAYVVVSSVLANPRNALYGTLLLLAGVPVFLFWRRRAAA